jgi:hypothetical protein
MELVKADDCLWLAHLPPSLSAHLEALPFQHKAILFVNGERTEWKRMRQGRDGRATPGFTIAKGKSTWSKIAKGATFLLEIPEGAAPVPEVIPTVNPEDPELVALVTDLKRGAKRYKELTGRPLGVTGEIAEFEGARAMGARLCPPREAGYDAVLPTSGKPIRCQIKGRSLLEPKKGRLGAIKLEHDWDVVWFVRLNEDFDLISIHEADRPAVTREIDRTPSKARKAGKLAIRDFLRISRQVWPAAT